MAEVHRPVSVNGWLDKTATMACGAVLGKRQDVASHQRLDQL